MGLLSLQIFMHGLLGGWNKHVNLGNGAPEDSWIQSWQGGLDQFRMYGKVLSDSEIMALYNSRLIRLKEIANIYERGCII